jgi:hypothetical protein
MRRLSMSMVSNKEQYYKALAEELRKENENKDKQIEAAITYIKDTKHKCGLATEPEEEHQACWDAILNAPKLINDDTAIMVQENTNADQD